MKGVTVSVRGEGRDWGGWVLLSGERENTMKNCFLSVLVIQKLYTLF